MGGDDISVFVNVIRFVADGMDGLTYFCEPWVPLIEIEKATNGDDAIAKVSENNYHIVLLDEMMTGKDGLETLQQIKASSPQTPVIMITKI